DKKTKDLIEPVALVQFGTLKETLKVEGFQAGTPSSYVFLTIGDKIKDLCNHYFEEENYLAGMLVNAIADDYLMQLDSMLEEKLQLECKEKGIGVIKRLEVPTDIPMEAQKIVLEETKADS